MIDTIFSAPVFSLEQANRVSQSLNAWTKKQDKKGWKNHGYYISIPEDNIFIFNYLVINDSGLSLATKEEISKIITDANLKGISIHIKPHPAHQ